MKVTAIPLHNFYQLEAAGKMISGFIDDRSKYRQKHFPAESTIIFDDTVNGNDDYNATLAFLTEHNIPYKIRKARLDNMVRFMIDITKIIA